MLTIAIIAALWFAGLAVLLASIAASERKEAEVERLREHFSRRKKMRRVRNTNCLSPRYWSQLEDRQVKAVAESWLQFVEDVRLCGIDPDTTPRLRMIQQVAGNYYTRFHCEGK